MSNYTVTTNFGAKDGLPSGNPAKLILGAQLTTEFTNIAAAILSKLDSSGTFVSSITGTANQIASSGTGAVTLSLQQNVIIPTPASGTALVANGASTGIVFHAISQGATGVPIIADTNTFTNSQNIQIAASGSTAGTYGIGLDSSVNLIIGRTDVAHTALTVSLTGSVTVSAPVSGVSLVVNGTSGTQALIAGLLQIGDAVGLVGSGTNIFTSSTNPIHIGTQGAALVDVTTNGVTRLTVSSSGAVTIAAPTGATALAVTGSANQHTANFIASSTAGSSFGVLIEAGTNATDAALEILNQAASVNYFRVHGDGGTEVGAPTGGNQGLGTLNATGLFVNGVAVGGAAAAGSLTGATLNATVVNSSLTSVGTLANLTVTNPIVNSAVASTGSFTGTLTGGTTSPTTACQYTKIGNSVTLRLGAQTFVSNAGTFTVTGIPAAIQPATAKFTTATLATDSTTPLKSALGQVSGGTLTLYLASAVGVYSSSGWTGSGTKGFGDLTLVWDLN